jgi:hypothetical protein
VIGGYSKLLRRGSGLSSAGSAIYEPLDSHVTREDDELVLLDLSIPPDVAHRRHALELFGDLLVEVMTILCVKEKSVIPGAPSLCGQAGAVGVSWTESEGEEVQVFADRELLPVVQDISTLVFGEDAGNSGRLYL